MSNIIPKDTKMAFEQVGWLGATGAYYPLGTPLTEIHAHEPGSYGPVYRQTGTWEWNEFVNDWRVTYD